MSQPVKENKMSVMPVNKLLVNMALPMVISMLIQACYNIVDSIFVAKISDVASSGSAGTDALVAVGLAFPFLMLLVAVGVGTGVGVNAMLSKSLGKKNYDEVNKAATNGAFLAALS